MNHRHSHPYNAGTEHVVLSPTRQTLPACIKREAKRREVTGESHEGRAASYQGMCQEPLARRMFLHMDDSVGKKSRGR